MDTINHKDCGVPREGFDVPRHTAESGGVHCKCCGSAMLVEDVDSMDMERIGIYRVICTLCPGESA